jgi:hypothetical protein
MGLSGNPATGEPQKKMVTESVSGPAIILYGDQLKACRFCSLALPESLETLILHYVSVHEFQVVADYIYEGARHLELDKHGRYSERAKRILKK